MKDESRSWTGLVARGAVAVARAVVRALPDGVKRRFEARLFHAVGHATRVTNDGYPQPAELARPAGPRTTGREPKG